jgi:ER lumen protein retaining receptor
VLKVASPSASNTRITSPLTNTSTPGVSLLTQLLYVIVFVARYLDLFWVSPTNSWWNFILKNFYIWSSFYIIFIMLRVFARTREREKAWRLGAYALGGSALATPLIGLIFEGSVVFRFTEFLWVFSIILESVCVLPQLLLLRQTTVPTVIDSGYLIALGSYRLLYLLNWIYRLFTPNKPEAIPVLFGIVQTALYVDFAWVYWTRQRVKLRGGGVVDSDDLRKGFLVHRALDHTQGARDSVDEAEAQDQQHQHQQQAPASRPPKTANRWGARGVSVSADDTLETHHQGKSRAPDDDDDDDGDEDNFLDDHDDDAPALGSLDERGGVDGGAEVLNSNAEWRDASPPATANTRGPPRL